MRLVLFVCGCCLIAVAPAVCRSAEQDASEELAALIDESWEYELREDPLFATRVGDARYNDRLPRETLADQQRRAEDRRGVLARLEAIDRNALSRSEQINYDILRRLLVDRVAEFEFNAHLVPITNREGFHIEFPELYKHTPLDDERDYENYIARLAAFDRYVQDHIELMSAGVEQGYTLPAVTLEGFRETIEPHIVDDPSRSLLYAPLREFPEKVPEGRREPLAAAARKAIAESVVPGYRRFLKFMQDEYLPAARGSIGASALPNGRDFYRHRIRHFSTLELSPEQVHELGLAEVERIRGEMESIIERVKFDGDRQAFVEFLRTDPRFYPKTPEQLMKEVGYTLKRIDGELPRLFKRLPRMPYGIREVPAYIAPRTTTAYYSLPSGDGTRAGFYYVNTYNLKSRPLFEIEALSLHEAVPGHHLQLALQQELDDLPAFRRFNGFTSFVEGWGLYAERLGLELGFYEDPYSDYGRLSYEMWRACRLVVDTGIHYLGWTRKQAIDFMAENTALSLHNIEAEVDRYIAWPGQAVAYKLGELKIRELRSRAEQQLGDKFDVRDFHAAVLERGSVPLDILEQNIDAYIAATKAAK